MKISLIYSNGSLLGQATAAEAYLEILRIWTINTTDDRHVLFSASTSAGIRIEPRFTKRNPTKEVPLISSKSFTPQNRDLRALDLVLRKSENYEAEETTYIMARAANRIIQGLEDTNFHYYKYILCFDLKVEKELNRLYGVLQQAALDDSSGEKKPPTAKIILLPTKYDEKNLTISAENLMNALEDWVQKNFQYKGKSWKVPGMPMMKGKWRTKQMLILTSQLEVLGRAQNGKSEWDKIEKETECNLIISWGRLYNTRLLTISGKKDKVENVVKRIEPFWLRP